MSLRKLTTGQQFGMQNIQSANAAFAWNGPLDGDLAFALGTNNQLAELIYFDNPSSNLTNGAARVNKDKKNGFGLGKSDESGLIDLAGILAANRTLPVHQQITEVGVGVLVQTPNGRDPYNNPARLGELQEAEVVLFNGSQPLFSIDVDRTFSAFPGGKVGEFKLIGGVWQFVAETRGFPDLDSMGQMLLMS